MIAENSKPHAHFGLQLSPNPALQRPFQCPFSAWGKPKSGIAGPDFGAIPKPIFGTSLSTRGRDPIESMGARCTITEQRSAFERCGRTVSQVNLSSQAERETSALDQNHHSEAGNPQC